MGDNSQKSKQPNKIAEPQSSHLFQIICTKIISNKLCDTSMRMRTWMTQMLGEILENPAAAAEIDRATRATTII